MASLGALAAVANGISSVAKAEALVKHPELQKGIAALTRLEFDLANDHLIGKNEYGLGGFTAVLNSELGSAAALNFSKFYREQMARIQAEAIRATIEISNCPEE